MMVVIDWQQVLAFAGAAAMVCGIWWRLQQQVTGNARTLDAYKLEAAEKYASIAHLKDVESRLVVSIDRLSDRIDRPLCTLEREMERS